MVYEGKPVGTPDSAQFFRVIEEHKVATVPPQTRTLKSIQIISRWLACSPPQQRSERSNEKIPRPEELPSTTCLPCARCRDHILLLLVVVVTCMLLSSTVMIKMFSCLLPESTVTTTHVSGLRKSSTSRFSTTGGRWLCFPFILLIMLIMISDRA